MRPHRPALAALLTLGTAGVLSVSAPAESAHSLSAALPAMTSPRAQGGGTGPAVPFTTGKSGGTSAGERAVARRVQRDPTTPQGPSDAHAYRAAMGPGPITDRSGRTWAAIPPAVGTRTAGTVNAVRGTSDAGRYTAYAKNPKGFRLPVESSATYRVTLGFVEPDASGPGQRVFDVTAEGKVVAAGLDLYAVAGPRTAYDLAVDVPVRDGELTIAFVPRAGVPVLSSVEVTSSSAVVVPEQPAQAVRFAPDNVWTRSIRTAPLAANSAAVGANVARQVAGAWGGTAAVNAYSYNVGLNVARPGTKKVTVGFHDCQKKKQVPAELYSGPAYFVDVPVPSDAAASKGTDAHMTVYDPAADKLWDFWQMRRTANGGWEACWGGRIDGVSASVDTAFPKYTGASASGLAIAGGAITVEEAMRGRITHAIDIGVIDARNWQYVSWPANRSDGITADPSAPWEGQRLRLDPRLDLSQLNLTPFARMVAEAAQEYGFIVCDRSGAVAVTTESALKQERATGANPWDWLLGGPAYDAMRDFPWSSLQALPPSYGK